MSGRFFAASSSSPSASSSSDCRHHLSRTQQPAPRFDAVLLDATGTLISPSEPAAEVREREKKGGMRRRKHQSRRRESERATRKRFPTSRTSRPLIFFPFPSLSTGLPPLRSAARPRPPSRAAGARRVPQGVQRPLAPAAEGGVVVVVVVVIVCFFFFLCFFDLDLLHLFHLFPCSLRLRRQALLARCRRPLPRPPARPRPPSGVLRGHLRPLQQAGSVEGDQGCRKGFNKAAARRRPSGGVLQLRLEAAEHSQWIRARRAR